MVALAVIYPSAGIRRRSGGSRRFNLGQFVRHSRCGDDTRLGDYFSSTTGSGGAKDGCQSEQLAHETPR